MKKWKTLSSKLAFNNKWFKVQQDEVELPNGTVMDDYFMWKLDTVILIVAITKENEFVLVKQYKHGAEEVLIEFPGGFVEEGENSLACAKRELAEETGYVSDDRVKLTEFYDNPTKIRGDVHVFLAKNAQLKHEQDLDISEEIEVITVPASQLKSMILNKEIKVSQSMGGAFFALNELNLI